MPNLPLVIADLLRQSAGDAEDAKLLLDRGRLRNGAKLARSACELLLRAVVATEQGSLPDGAVRPDQIPGEHPLRQDLMQAFRLAGSETRETGIPRAEAVRQSLRHTEAALDEAARAFDVALDGAAPARNVRPIRPPPPPPPPLPKPQPLSTPEPPPKPPPAAVRPRAPATGRSIVSKQPLRRPPAAVLPAQPTAVPRTRDRAPPVTPARQKTSSIGAIVDHRPASDARRPAERPDRHPQPANTSRATSARRDAEQPTRQTPREMPSTAFWSLMDRWQIPDLDALQLIGHPGGLTGKGTRPRFRVKGSEAERLALLHEVQDRLQALGEAPPEWLQRSVQAAPFDGASPVEHISRHGEPGVRDVLRRLTQLSFTAAT